MFLTASNVFYYLRDTGLVSEQDVLDGNFAVVEAGRRNRNFKILRQRGDGLFVKQVPLVHPETISSFLKEAASGQIAAEAAETSALRAAIPQLKRFDPAAQILVHKAYDSAETLAELVARCGAIPDFVPGLLGRTLAACHVETARPGALSRIGLVLTGQPPWIFTIGQRAEMVMPNMNAARRQVVEHIRATPELYNGLLDLQSRWRRICLMHGDLKWENVLLIPVADGEHELRLIDWELADFGEPLWDVANLLASFLQYWLFNLPLQHLQADVNQALAHAPVRLGAVQHAALAFWTSYLDVAGRDLPVGPGLAADTARLVGVRLVLLAFEILPDEPAITPHTAFALQLARYLLAYPAQALSDLFGVTAQLLASRNSSSQQSSAQSAGAAAGAERARAS